jgi:hypothetical protein
MIPPMKFSLPEPDAELSQDVIDRLAHLGYVTPAAVQKFTDILKQNGELSLMSRLTTLEHSARSYAEWFPKLRNFAADCRGSAPILSDTDQSPAEREECRILHSKMLAFSTSQKGRGLLASRRNQAVLVATTPAALGAAVDVFGGVDNVVVISDQEMQHWFSAIFQPDEDLIWWFTICSWTVSPEFGEDAKAYISRNHPAPQGFAYWDVISSESYGPLAGQANHELYSWNGTKAEFVETYCFDTW